MTNGMRDVRTTAIFINFKMPLVYLPVVLHMMEVLRYDKFC